MINFAIIGCGNIAGRHAEQIAKIGKLQAVCDINESKAIELATRYHCSYYFSLNSLLEKENNLDIVVICTPNGLHAQQTILALNKGMHVICEKPMAINVNDCNAMIEASNKARKHIFVVKQNRFNPPVVAVKKLLDESRLGKILSLQLNCFWNRNEDYYSNSWKGTIDLDGGALFTQFSHFIDLLLWFFGDVEVEKSFISNSNHKNCIEFEDTGVVILKFKNNILGTINYTLNSFKKNMEGSLTIFGDKGTVKIGGEYLNTIEYQNIDSYTIKNLSEGNAANNYGSYTGSMSNHHLVYKNVIDVLNNNANISTNSIEGLKTVELISRIYSNAIKIGFNN